MGPGPGQHREPPPPEAAVPTATLQSSAPAVEPPGTTARPLVAEDPGFRLLLEDNAFQSLLQETLLKKPRTTEDALSVAGSNLLCLPFPKKLWRLVNRSRFTSIWWEKDGTSIGLNEKLFQKEILERDGTNKVFETDCTKSFIGSRTSMDSANCARTCTSPSASATASRGDWEWGRSVS